MFDSHKKTSKISRRVLLHGGGIVSILLLVMYVLVQTSLWGRDGKIHLTENALAENNCGPDCDGIYEYRRVANLCAIDTLPGFKMQRHNRMLLTGAVLTKQHQAIANAIVYIYHSDSLGIYPRKSSDIGAEPLHGYLRGWAKTDENGRYYFFTCKPGPYPKGTQAAHIHCSVLTPNKQLHQLEELLFEKDYEQTLNHQISSVKASSNLLQVSSVLNGSGITVYQHNIQLD